MGLRGANRIRSTVVLTIIGTAIAAVSFFSFAQTLTLENDIGPINKNITVPSRSFSGDQPNIPHEILWNKAKFIKSLPGGVLPAPKETVDTVIVGGGIGGLL